VRASEPLLRTELPEPTAELFLLRVFAEAFISTMPRKRGEAFLRAAAEIMAREESLAAVIPIRPEDRHASATARREAMATFRRDMPVFLARLPDE
jgi:hypothetical protein